MKRIKQMLCLIIFAGIGFVSMDTYATNTVHGPEVVTNKPQEVQEPVVNTIKTEEKISVRITQPPKKDDIQTFDSQMNVMGEAIVGTDIIISVTYDTNLVDLQEDQKTVEYKLKTVGATQTFNQLIDLKEGENTIVLRYVNGSDKGILTLKIKRMSESERQLIKSYITPQAIVDKITTPQASEKEVVPEKPLGTPVTR
ncbi:MAG: hypothetical protein ACRDDX_08790 [Cellulosilyticaceae bacterium]